MIYTWKTNQKSKKYTFISCCFLQESFMLAFVGLFVTVYEFFENTQKIRQNVSLSK